jgi:hypothetical protein
MFRVLVIVFLLALVSMETTSSSIRIIQHFFQRQGLLPSVNGDIKRSNFYRYGLTYLTSSDQFCNFFHGFHEDDNFHNICPGFYVN